MVVIDIITSFQRQVSKTHDFLFIYSLYQPDLRTKTRTLVAAGTKPLHVVDSITRHQSEGHDRKE